jgi:predicted CoA-binding protein
LNVEIILSTPDILHILKTCKTIAVVGLSPKVYRDSYEVSEYMQSQSYRIIPINPVAAASNTPILGEKVYATLADAAKVEKIDMVDCFRNSADIPPVATESVQIKAQVLWMQLGIENEAAKAEAESAGLAVVENRCLLIEHRRLTHASL